MTPGNSLADRATRLSLPLAAVLVWLLVCSPIAPAAISGGHNPPTRKLELAFKVAGGVRAVSDDGCYLPPRAMAVKFRRWVPAAAEVAPDFDSVRETNVVYVISGRSSCNRLLMALRARGRLYLLDTLGGEVYVQGQRRRQDDEVLRGGRGPLRDLTVVTRTYTFGKPHNAKRLEVRCPESTFPLGGGMISTPALGGDGEGVYPQSYERLGTQRGYHITAVVIDPTPTETNRRWTTIQAVCGKGLVPQSAPHTTVFVRRNETNSAIAACPSGQYLLSGGFQRTNFSTPYLTFGGNYITESRAISPRAWAVTAHAAGRDGGELTAIAYCARSKRPLITEVSASTPIARYRSATATTPACAPGLEMTSGGFSLNGHLEMSSGGLGFNGSPHAFFTDGSIGADGTWSATGYGYFGEALTLTAYGYCLHVSR